MIVGLLQWFIEDGDNAAGVIVKVNELRKKDALLRGVQFMPQFNVLIR